MRCLYDIMSAYHLRYIQMERRTVHHHNTQNMHVAFGTEVRCPR